MQSRQAVPVVPVMVGLRTAANKQGQSKSFARPSSSSSGPPGLHRPFVLRCGTRLPCSLVDVVHPLLSIHGARSAWSTTPITPAHIGQSHQPVLPLPTSPFSPSPSPSPSPQLLRAAVPGVFGAATSRAAKTATLDRHLPAQQQPQILDVFALSHSYQHCPPVRLSAAFPPPLFSQPTSVYQTRARLKKNPKES